jgi:long-chain acyl-CoA synthetase
MLMTWRPSRSSGANDRGALTGSGAGTPSRSRVRTPPMNTFRSPITRAAACFGDATAFIDHTTGQTTTFNELADHVDRIGGLLDSLGVKSGERVAVLAEGSSTYAELYLAIPAAGRVIVPLNTRYQQSELEAACRDCSPRVLFTDRSNDTTNGLAEVVLPIDSQLHELVASSSRTQPGPIDENAVAAIFYTGGTTDRAKGVCLSHRNKLADAETLIIELELSQSDRWLVMSPMFHAAGSFNVLPCVWQGAVQVFLPRFDAATALRVIEEHRITLTFGVPTMLTALAEAQKVVSADVSSMRLIGHGGAPVTRTTLAETIATFPNTEICVQYGATEMAPLATVGRHQEKLVGSPAARAAGRSAVGVEVTIQDEEGAELPRGKTGEIVVTGPNIMLGYWQKPEATEAVLSADSYRSGDLGYMDEEGRVYVVDRRKDMIITGGENVYSVEVEDILALHPAIIEAAVIGEPHELWGEIVVAIVVCRNDVPLEELDTHCRGQLASYKIPRRYILWGEPLPRTPAGKLLKRELREAI